MIFLKHDNPWHGDTGNLSSEEAGEQQGLPGGARDSGHEQNGSLMDSFNLAITSGGKRNQDCAVRAGLGFTRASQWDRQEEASPYST